MTSRQPKALIEIADRPLLDHARHSLAAVGVKRVFVVVSHFAEQIESHLNKHPVPGQESSTVWQPVPQGTGQAVKLAAAELKPGPMWIIYSDVLLDSAGYAAMAERFEADLCDVLLGVVHTDDPCERAAVYTDGSGRVSKMVPQPKKGTSETSWSSTGVYIAQQSLIPLLDDLQPSARGEYRLSTAINQLAESGGDVTAHELSCFWTHIIEPDDIGHAEELLEERSAAKTQ